MTGKVTAVLTAATTAAVLSWTGSSSAQIFPRAVRCLHGVDETQTDRARREQALTMARAINRAEGQALQQSGRFQPVASLSNIPAAPTDIEVRLYADANRYVVSLKDTGDLCRFGIFSDQSGTVYSSTPTVPQMAGR